MDLIDLQRSERKPSWVMRMGCSQQDEGQTENFPPPVHPDLFHPCILYLTCGALSPLATEVRWHPVGWRGAGLGQRRGREP